MTLMLFRFQIDRAGPFAGRLNDEAVARADFWFSQASLRKISVGSKHINAVIGRDEAKAAITQCFDASVTTIKQCWTPNKKVAEATVVGKVDKIYKVMRIRA